MTDLINRQALLGVFAGLVPYAIDGPEDDAYARGLDAGYQAVVEAPAVDAEPVKKGKWLYHRVSRIGNTCIEHVQTEKCSVCKRYITTPFVYGRTVNNYCTHCGAKMEAGE